VTSIFAPEEIMAVEKKVALDLEDLPLDVFELADRAEEVESLTGGHGLAETAASFPSCGCSCCCCGY
jgi:thiazolylpeptide-type bacteriocin precursor